jgi:hypothetical protein
MLFYSIKMWDKNIANVWVGGPKKFRALLPLDLTEITLSQIVQCPVF